MKRAEVCLLLAAALPARALADGAFPEEMAVFFPAAVPGEVVLTTNFGVLISTDGGATFRWVCEEPGVAPVGNLVTLYQVADDGTILADSGTGAYASTDGACSFTQAAGALAGVSVVDAAFDPTQPGYAIALASPAFGQGTIHASTDDGRSFGAPLWAGDADLTGVEFSRSQPGRVYVTGTATCSGGAGGGAFLLRSDDRGQSWTTFDLSSLGPAVLRILQVDPSDAQTVYFRATVAGPTGGDWLLWTHDGGQTLSPGLALDGSMSGFLLASDGSLYLATTQDEILRLPAGGHAFQAFAGGPHLLALAENGGTLWGCADETLDQGMVLGTSTNEGQSFCTAFGFRQIAGMLGCGDVATACASQWGALVQELQIGADGGPGACLGAGDAGSLALAATLPAGTPVSCAVQLFDAGMLIDAGSVADGSMAGASDAGLPRPSARAASRGCGYDGAADAGVAVCLAIFAALRRRNGRELRDASP